MVGITNRIFVITHKVDSGFLNIFRGAIFSILMQIILPKNSLGGKYERYQ